MSRLPQLTASELVAFLRKQGFEDSRQTGSHLTLRHPTTGTSVTVPIHGSSDIGRGLATRVLRDAGFSQDDFLRSR